MLLTKNVLSDYFYSTKVLLAKNSNTTLPLCERVQLGVIGIKGYYSLLQSVKTVATPTDAN